MWMNAPSAPTGAPVAPRRAESLATRDGDRARRRALRLVARGALGACAPALWLLMSACGGAPEARVRYVPPPRPATVTEVTYPQVRRGYERTPADDPARSALREELWAFQLRDASALVEAEDYDGVIARITSVTALCTPHELEQGKLPRELRPLAQYLADAAAPRGDEARALSGNLLLHLLQPDVGADSPHRRMYDGIREWGFDSRAAIAEPLSQFSEGLIEVWQQHVKMVPTPETMGTLADLLTQHQAAAQALIGSSERRMPEPEAFYMNWQNAASDVAAVYLRHGDVASALARVKAMGATGRLLEWLQQASEDGTEGATALIELSRRAVRRGTPQVARGICLSGLRRFSYDVRFHRCLAQVAALHQDASGAIAWHAEAVAMAPEDRTTHDVALRDLSGLIERGMFSEDPAATRPLSNEATRILQLRMQRFPDTPPPVTPEALYRHIAIAEMNAGDAREAELRLRASIEAKPTVEGHRQLANLLSNTGRQQEAATQYRAALDLLEGHGLRQIDKRAELLERLGDAQRLAGDPGAKLAYAESLALWDGLMARLRNKNISVAQLRRGVLLARLAEQEQSVEAFKVAIRSAPEMKETYRGVLSHLAIAPPNADFAQSVFRQAVNQLSVRPRWKVYFALWLRLVAARQGVELDEEVRHVLLDQAAGEDWTSHLAAFGAGEIDYPELLRRAGDRGQRAEAHFYEGVRLIGEGDNAAAARRMQQVLDTQMINFYEYSMAQELLRLPDLQPTSTGPAPDTANAAQ